MAGTPGELRHGMVLQDFLQDYQLSFSRDLLKRGQLTSYTKILSSGARSSRRNGLGGLMVNTFFLRGFLTVAGLMTLACGEESSTMLERGRSCAVLGLRGLRVRGALRLEGAMLFDVVLGKSGGV